MKPQEITHTSQLDFSFETHGAGGAAKAAKLITEGKTVRVDTFVRDLKDSRSLTHTKCSYIGLLDLDSDGKLALRESGSTDLDCSGSHSLIPSWNDNAGDVVLIAATIANYFSRSGADYFFNLTTNQFNN